MRQELEGLVNRMLNPGGPGGPRMLGYADMADLTGRKIETCRAWWKLRAQNGMPDPQIWKPRKRWSPDVLIPWLQNTNRLDGAPTPEQQ